MVIGPHVRWRNPTLISIKTKKKRKKINAFIIAIRLTSKYRSNKVDKLLPINNSRIIQYFTMYCKEFIKRRLLLDKKIRKSVVDKKLRSIRDEKLLSINNSRFVQYLTMYRKEFIKRRLLLDKNSNKSVVEMILLTRSLYCNTISDHIFDSNYRSDFSGSNTTSSTGSY